MSDHLASLFGSAVGMLPSAPERSLELFTEITNYDESACDAWVGRIRCGDTDRVTLFRAWYSRTNFGQLAGAAEISMNSVNARIPIGGLFGDITYPINSPLAITMGFAVNEAAEGNYADAMEALEEVQANGAEHLVAWVKAVIYAAAERWTDVIDEVRGASGWPDKVLAAAGGVAHGVAAANLGLFTEAERRLTESNASPAGQACAPAIAWYLAMTRRSQGNEDAAVALLEWLQATHPEPKVAAALRDPNYRLETTTPEKIASRTDPWDPSSVVADTSGREKLLAEAQAELDRQIGLGRVKQQIEAYRAATQMAKLRAARGMKVAQTSKHMIFAGPPGTGKTTIARVVAKIYCGLGILKKETVREVHRADLVGQHIGETEAKTNAVIDSALDGVLFLDEAYALVSTGAKNDFGLVAIDTLLARMENDRDRLVVIIAGYRADLDKFLDTNEGLRSRFTRSIDFPSYSPHELVEMAKLMAAKRDSVFEPAALTEMERLFGHLAESSTADAQGVQRRSLDVAGNGRFVRNLVERSEEEREYRLDHADIEDFTDEELMTITLEDVNNSAAPLLRGLGLTVPA